MWQKTLQRSYAGHDRVPDALRTKVLDWMYTLFTHNQNETQAILRAATATGYGLDPSKFVSTFPGSTTNVTIVGGPAASQNAERPTLNAERPTSAADVQRSELDVGRSTLKEAPAAGGAPVASVIPEAPAVKPPPAVSLPVASVAPAVSKKTTVPAGKGPGWVAALLLGLLLMLGSGGLVWSFLHWAQPTPGTPGTTPSTAPAPVAPKTSPETGWRLLLPDASKGPE